MENQEPESRFSQQSEHYDLESQKELRHLKETISALREELDQAHAETDRKSPKLCAKQGRKSHSLKKLPRT